MKHLNHSAPCATSDAIQACRFLKSGGMVENVAGSAPTSGGGLGIRTAAGPFKCVVADPPWPEKGGGKIKRGADRHYPVMDIGSIIYTMQMAEVWNIAESAHLWLWTTNNYIPDGLTVMHALGFRYVTNLVWCKDKIGLGQYLRGQHELCLFGVKGDAMMPEIRNVPSVVHAVRGRHSAKPAEAYAAIERVSPGPRLEIFAREPRSGWTVWGNEVAA